MARRYEGTPGLSPTSLAVQRARTSVSCSGCLTEKAKTLAASCSRLGVGTCVLLVGEAVLDQACTAIESRMRPFRRRASAAY
jgi:hypothetical protein